MSSEPSRNYFAYYGTSGSSESDGIILQGASYAPLSLGDSSLISQHAKAGFLRLNQSSDLMFATETGEGGAGVVNAFQRDAESGFLTKVSTGVAGGGGLCHLNLDRSERWLFAVSYQDAIVSVFPVTDDGQLGELAQSFKLDGEGSGVDAERQEAPHAHSIYADPTNRYVFVCDLGMDRIYVFQFDATSGVLQPAETPFLETHPGAGPRHLAFHSNGQWIYAINELNGTIAQYAWSAEKGDLSFQSVVDTLPGGFDEWNTTAEILVHPSGRFLYGSNRGHDSIVVYAIDEENGALDLVQRVSSRGEHPRNFVLDPTGDLLAVANRDSDNVVYFSIDAESGTLELLETVEGIPACTCVRLLNRGVEG